MREKFIVALVGIGAVTTIVVACIFNGVDGTVVAGGCGMIGTIVGYCFGRKKNGK